MCIRDRDWDDVKKYANNRIDEVANLYGPGLAAQYAGKEGWQPIEPGDVCWEDINGDGAVSYTHLSSESTNFAP